MKRIFYIFVLIAVLALASCNRGQQNNTSPYRNRITIDYYASTINFAGLAEGFTKNLLNEKFNMDINFIAPNIAGEQIYQTRSAAGNLGDIIVTGGPNPRDVYDAGLAMDITDLLQQRGSQLLQDKTKIDVFNAKHGVTPGRTYWIPGRMSHYSPTEILPAINGAMLGLQEGAAAHLRWDAYKAVGMPQINTMEDLLPALKLMQDYVKTSDSGKPVYGMTIFNDWDGEYMTCAGWFLQMYGYKICGTSIFTWVGADEVRTQRIDDDNGQYLRTLKFFYNANQMGLMDPDSPTNTWGDVWNKLMDGQTLMSGWTWAGMGYNNPERGNANPPKGFEFIPILDADYFAMAYNPGSQWTDGIAIGSKAKDPERLMDFINWTATPEALQFHAWGPQGLAYDVQGGKPYLTDFGSRALYDQSIAIPAEYGGGAWDSVVAWHRGWTAPYHWFDLNPQTGLSYYPALWPDVLNSSLQDIDRIWRADTGADHALDYLQKNNLYTAEVGTDYVEPEHSVEIRTAKDTCRMIVRNASWRMVFAPNEAEFNSIWLQMKADLLASGWEDVVRVDLQTARDLVASRQEVLRNLR